MLPPVGEALVAREQAACEAEGGRWGAGGKGGVMLCYHDTKDAGRQCSAASDCEGFCLSRSRTCAPVRPLFGCNDILDGRGQPTKICVD